jgi:acetyl-CoA C-acetyltransferase
MSHAYLISGARTPIGSFLGGFANLPAPELGAVAIRSAVERSGISFDQFDEVIMGNVIQAGVGQAPARQAALKAGFPSTIPCLTVNKVCGSGLKAVMLASQAIRCGDARAIVAGGMENMSQVPHYLPGSRLGPKFGNTTLVDGLTKDGLMNVYDQQVMGVCADLCAKEHNYSREQQDALALASQQKATAAQDAGKFVDEIVPVSIPQRKGDPVVFAADEYINRKTNADALAGLRPAFDKAGSVTAGNASGLNDGAAAVVVMSASKAKALGLKPLARIVSYATSGLDPATMGLGPVFATRKALERAGWSAQDVDLFELNEAFAAQACAVNQDLGIDPAKVNVNGGAIAIGHPIGASGARILVTLLHEMQRSGAKKGLAGLCIGGGMGVAMAVERV